MPPIAPQARAPNFQSVSVRAMADNAVSADDASAAWAKVKASVASDEGLRNIAQLQKAMNEVRDEVGRDAKVSPSPRHHRTRRTRALWNGGEHRAPRGGVRARLPGEPARPTPRGHPPTQNIPPAPHGQLTRLPPSKNHKKQPLAPIDWENLKKRSGMPELIEEWRKGLANVKYPAYDGNEVAETAAVFKDLIAQAEKLSAAAKAREAEIDAELASLAEDKAKLSTVTMDEVFEKDPALKEEVEQRIREGKWF